MSVILANYFDLEGEGWSKRIDTLMPPGNHLIEPGDIVALYCCMDKALWKRGRRLILRDLNGGKYVVEISTC